VQSIKQSGNEAGTEYDDIRIRKKIEVPKHPHFLNPLAKFAVLVYNHLRSRGILACPTVVQSETNNQFKN